MEPSPERLNKARKSLSEKRAQAQAAAAFGDALELIYLSQINEIDRLLVELDTPGSKLRQEIAAREHAQ